MKNQIKGKKINVILPLIITILALHINGIIPIQSAEAMQLRSFPKKLRYDEPFTIQYSPTSRLPGSLQDPYKMTLLIYKDLLNPPEEVEMVKKDNTWQATITISDTSIKMFMYAFRAETVMDIRAKGNIDTNDGNYWDILLHDAARVTVQGAHQARAVSYTGMGGLRKENLELAHDEISSEIALYRKNYSARNLLYSILLRQYEYSDDVRSNIEKDIYSLLNKYPQDASVMKFAVNGYRMIGETEKAEDIENRIIQKDPKSDQAAMRIFSGIMEIEEADLRAEQLETFLTEYPNTRASEFALTCLASAVIDLNDSHRMIQVGDKILESSTSLSGASALAGIAGILAEEKFELKRATIYAQKAISLIQSTALSSRPSEISVEEWTNRIRTTIARYQDILGWALVQQNRLEEGLSELQKAVHGTAQPGVHYHIAVALEKSGDTEKALIHYARAVAFGGDISDMAHEAFKKLWLVSGNIENESNLFLEQQEDWLRQNYQKRILSQRSLRPAPDFELEDRSGGWIQLSDQKNNVIVLCFWASWSKSSRLLLSEIQNLADTYGQDVLFLTIATDANLSNLDRFLKDKQVELPILYNDGTDKDYGLQGVPTVFVIDAKGNIHFEHRGYKPDIKEILSIELEDLL
jgi:tetratricopeptide (TPR) repeat protein